MYWKERKARLTIVANHIVHFPGWSISILLVVEQQSSAPDTRDTAESAKTRRTSANDYDIVIGLWDRNGGSQCQQREEGALHEHGDG